MIRNLTPHRITIIDVDNVPHVVGTFRQNDLFVIARRESHADIQTREVDGSVFAFAKTTFGSPLLGFFKVVNDGLPQHSVPLNESALFPFAPGDLLVVSRVFLDAPEAKEWASRLGVTLAAPGELLRDAEGKPVGAKGFSV